MSSVETPQLEKSDVQHLDKHLESGDENELKTVLAQSNIPRWSPDSLRLYLGVFCACLCAFANGYDGSLMTALLAMPAFNAQFGRYKNGALVEVQDDGTLTGIIFSLYTVGSMVGAPFAATISDRLGRRKAMFIGAWIIIIGMVLTSTSHHVEQFIVGRFVLGFGIAIMTVAAPAYSMEIAPPQWRGRATGIYNCGWFGGSVPAAAITFGTSFINGQMSWRLPLILQAVACFLVMVILPFVPESPRYLMAQNRVDEAHAFLTKYHGNGNPEDALVMFELREMKASIALDGIDKRWWDYRPLFFSRGGRWRMAQVLMISIFGQFSGNGLGAFNTIIFKNLGVITVAGQLGYNLLNQCISAFCALTAATLTDRMPRRLILPWGTLGCAALLGINSGLSAVLDKQVNRPGFNGEGPISLSVAQGALAAYFLFNCLYSFTYTPLQGVVPVEALTTTMRAKGLAASGFIVSAIGFINMFAGPIGLQNLGYKYIYVFVAWDCVEALCWYLFGVESQGRTLEELDWIYEQPNPVKASKRVKNIVVDDSGFQAAN
ncbi:hypothetical protein CspeluHIS016_0107360 [Cutaneotrichosporon spelunceum]|uniref:Major facilitator superfamily (MFS) profile domain-containing protein n=1 Tax=Cutaneotrichosporon spelunceum TaxID=1672016 RepID=A0AAD3TNX5_9TREE|nr:hypothetical protein CspeluHIS016_0107360 [Cutaneotrichosporon spelunceum]